MRPRLRTSCLVAVILLHCLGSPLAAQAAEPPGWPACNPGEIEVVLFGTFHMAGSRDDIQRNVDNMLSARRQAEMPAVVAWLTATRADRVAVEVPWTDREELAESYAAYLRGERELGANEVHQLGFRTAEALGHARIHAIDYRLGIGNDSISAFYDRRPEARERNRAIWEEVERASEADDRRLAESTLLDYLRRENSEESLRAEANRAMYAHLIAGEDGNYGGADLVARWYERNAKMAHHIARVTLPSDRRVLVIVGSGHVRPLRDVLDLSPHFCPLSPLRFAP